MAGGPGYPEIKALEGLANTVEIPPEEIDFVCINAPKPPPVIPTGSSSWYKEPSLVILYETGTPVISDFTIKSSSSVFVPRISSLT